MGGIHVAAHNYAAAFPSQLVHVLQEGVVELHLVPQAFGGLLAVGEIDAQEDEIIEVGDDGAALAVEALHAQAKGDAAGFVSLTGVETHAAVALSFRGGEAAGITLDLFKGVGQLVLVGLGFLEAQHVGLRFLKPVQEPLLVSCPNAVDVPGYHASCPKPSVAPSAEGGGNAVEVTILTQTSGL